MTEHFKIRSIRYATVVIRGFSIFALIFCAVTTGGIYVTNHLLARVYSATAALEVQTQAVGSETYSGWAFSSPQGRAIQAELESIESPEILRTVVSDLGLDKAWAERVYNRSDPLTTEDAVRYLENHLRPKFKHDSKVVEITALSDDPKEAADIANEMVTLYKGAHTASPGEVKITARAEVPTAPSSPNRRICYAVSAGIAGMLGVMVACSVEICFLIARAEAASELRPPQ
jgi:capsular polysaccharide biosynthesis protein